MASSVLKANSDIDAWFNGGVVMHGQKFVYVQTDHHAEPTHLGVRTYAATFGANGACLVETLWKDREIVLQLRRVKYVLGGQDQN